MPWFIKQLQGAVGKNGWLSVIDPDTVNQDGSANVLLARQILIAAFGRKTCNMFIKPLWGAVERKVMTAGDLT